MRDEQLCQKKKSSPYTAQMGQAITCDRCNIELPQGEGPHDSPPVWEWRGDHAEDVHHLCTECHDPERDVLRSVWFAVAEENARAMRDEGQEAET